MAGIRGKSGPPTNQNAFKHGLATVAVAALTSDEADYVLGNFFTSDHSGCARRRNF
jgi:hypothetical protein